jgi:hypothetical protein
VTDVVVVVVVVVMVLVAATEAFVAGRHAVDVTQEHRFGVTICWRMS